MTQTLYAEKLISLANKYGTRGILLDTNVLLLLIFAEFQPTMIGGKRLEKYSVNDGELLKDYVGRFGRILTTPYVLAETSNLASQIVYGRLKTELFTLLHPMFCQTVPDSFEHCAIDGKNIDRYLFCRLGLTDSSLATLVKTDQLLLTDDLDLHIAFVSAGGEAINFTHMIEVAQLV